MKTIYKLFFLFCLLLEQKAQATIFTFGENEGNTAAFDNFSNGFQKGFDGRVFIAHYLPSSLKQFRLGGIDFEAIPVINDCPSEISISNNGGSCGAIVSWTPPTATDENGFVTLTSNFEPGSFFPVGTTVVTYTATDLSGNSVSCSFDVTVTNTEKPVINANELVTQFSEPGTCAAMIFNPIAVSASVTFNCETIEAIGVRSDGLSLVDDPYPVGITTITWTAISSDGIAADEFVTTVETQDIDRPEIVQPDNIAVNTDPGSCFANLSISPPLVNDNCDTGIVPVGVRSDGLDINDPYPVGPSILIQWIATDAAGNESFGATQLVTVMDVEKPIITQPTDLVFSANENVCQSFETISPPFATDNCTEELTINGIRSDGQSLSVGYPVGETTITWTAIDAYGNESDAVQQRITVVDDVAPVISVCPEDIVEEGIEGENGKQIFYQVPIAFDNCSTAEIELIDGLAPGSIFPNGMTVVTYRATDALGNFIDCTFTVTVTAEGDTEAPVINDCPSNITLSNDSGSCVAVVNWTPPSGTDNSGSVTLATNFEPGSSFPIGTTVVTYTATDPSGNSATCSFEVNVPDTEAPVITCPADITTTVAFGETGAVVTFDLPTATDNCGVPVLQLIDGLASGSLFPIGTTTVTYQAADAAGNTQNCSFTVTVTAEGDTEAPVINDCPTNITVSNDSGSCGAVVDWTPPSGSDNSGSVTLATNFEPGSSFPIGNTVVTYTATDPSGNSATCSFEVKVADTEAPVITCPADITTTVVFGETGAVVTFDLPTATDNCGTANVVFFSGFESGSVFPVGTTSVIYSAFDAAGNSVSCSFTVTIIAEGDTEAPVINDCPSNITLSNDSGSCVALVNWTPPSGSDNSGSVTLASNFEPGSSFPIGTTVVTYTATDPSGNSATCSFEVNVVDTEAPVITCPADITTTVAFGETGAVVTFDLPTATDNCGVPVLQLIDGLASGSLFPIGTTTVSYQAADAAGNTQNCSFTVTVTAEEDTEAPVINDCPTNITVSNDSGSCGANVNWTSPSGTDNSGSVILTSNFEPGSSFPVGTTLVTYTATDPSGNSASCSFEVTVNDNEFPAATAPNDLFIEISASQELAENVFLGNPIFNDNCGIESVSNNAPMLFSLGSTTVKWFIQDVSNNTTTVQQTVTISQSDSNCTTSEKEWIDQNQYFYLDWYLIRGFAGINPSIFSGFINKEPSLQEALETGLVPIQRECHSCADAYSECVYDSCFSTCISEFLSTGSFGEGCTECIQNTPCLQDFVSCVGLVDEDGDGWSAGSDCDDNDPEKYPRLWFLDNDGDGYGTKVDVILSCEPIEGYSTVPGDCDDSNPEVNPGEVEVCGDGIDNDCNGFVDPDSEWYRDQDGDGFGIFDDVVYSCEQPEGYVIKAGDCDDTNPDVFPGAEDICDGIDNNCNGEVDENFTTVWYLDNDGDGFGNSAVTVLSCDQPDGYVDNGLDCNDDNPQIFPGQGCGLICTPAEVNWIDQNQYFYLDWYLIGVFGSVGPIPSIIKEEYLREALETGFVPIQRDCHTCADIYSECVYNSCFSSCFTEFLTTGSFGEGCSECIKNTPCLQEFVGCVGLVDEDGDGWSAGSDCDDNDPEKYPRLWFLDNDGDGYGTKVDVILSCEPIEGYSTVPGDCDDSNPEVNPGEVEVCGDGIDNDCNGFVDPDSEWYRDQDGDGFGIFDDVVYSCEQPEGYVNKAGDCDDTNPDVFPGAEDICDGIDNNCNGEVDENFTTVWYLDNDGDGFGNSAVTVLSCDQPDGYMDNGLDCNDDNPQIFPGQGCGLICTPAEVNWINQNQYFYLDWYLIRGFASIRPGIFPLNKEPDLEEAFISGEIPLAIECHACADAYTECVYNTCFNSCLADFLSTGSFGEGCAECVRNTLCLQEFVSCVGLVDEDGDGWSAGSDCDDNDPEIFREVLRIAWLQVLVI
jgi:hypothetical protein